MTKINYIVTVEGDLGFAQPTTLKSIESNLNPNDKITQVCFGTKTEEEALNEYTSTLKEGEFTHICIINDGSLLKEFASQVIEPFIVEPETVYLPIVELNNDEVPFGKVMFKGFLNASIWKPYLAEEVGVLDLTLSKRGVDLVLYGALIPVSVVQKYKFKTDIKYYSFFEYLNRIINSSVPVLGIPKVTLKCIKDYELKGVPKQEKIDFFKKATTDYLVV